MFRVHKQRLCTFVDLSTVRPQATNQKNLTTWAVKTSFTEPFQSVQSCLPLALTFNTANNASVKSYQFSVNTTDLEYAFALAVRVAAALQSVTSFETFRNALASCSTCRRVHAFGFE